jgi:hypothetical protein
MFSDEKRLSKIRNYYLEDFDFRKNIYSSTGLTQIENSWPDILLSFDEFAILFWGFRDVVFDSQFSKRNEKFYSFAWNLGAKGKIAEIRRWKNWNALTQKNFLDSEIDDSLSSAFHFLDVNAFRLGLLGAKYDLNDTRNDLSEILFNRAGLDFYYGNKK